MMVFTWEPRCRDAGSVEHLSDLAAAFQILSKGQPLDNAIEKHGNPFVKQEWKLFIKTVAPGRVDSRFSSHVKRVLKLKRE